MLHRLLKTNRQVSFSPKGENSTFRHVIETPFSVGIDIWLYHNFRSKRAIDFMSGFGIGMSYDELMKFYDALAVTVHESMKKNDQVYIPPGLEPRPFRATIDNIDINMDPPDGRNTFHALSMELSN